MRFFSTRDSDRRSPATLAQAVRRGIAPDGGLYMPERIEPLPAAFFDGLHETSWQEAATTVAQRLFGDDVDAERLVREALDFPIPLVEIEDGVHVLELFHGPTLAFKDVGARSLARLLAWTRDTEDDVTVLVATSGDTGGAVAQAFHGVAGTRVAVLYPAGKVSPLQERQFSTLGGNILALAVDGVFDDCQRLVKEAFADDALRGAMELTSANSINIGRLLPQAFYYFWAVAQLRASGVQDAPIVCVPSGNFGNLAAGLIAKRLGLGIRRFVAATNVNDVVPEYLVTGTYSPRPSQATISNAMDVGDPSNFSRIETLYDSDIDALRRDVVGSRWEDETTRRTIEDVLKRRDYLLDPHTAVGYLGLQEARREIDAAAETPGVVLATAHPAKFREVVEPILGREIDLPEALASRRDAEVVSEPLANDLDALRARLLAW